jgi:hypothetical protein
MAQLLPSWNFVCDKPKEGMLGMWQPQHPTPELQGQRITRPDSTI